MTFTIKVCYKCDGHAALEQLLGRWLPLEKAICKCGGNIYAFRFEFSDWGVHA